ncbi:hypothetical protein DBR23_02700 [Acidovorax sp. HMWF018]|uniref:hypothetical protein n=1 Tax=Acidovorax sp. HMWF018 TaxID=2056855 RepID=UPI000D384D56|nr:hypothetical protein [Acidovorax sp. HMWF018]PTT42809.1 hypothetical protein DBR23_02700 [Acidovorax sp. HMWF018]
MKFIIARNTVQAVYAASNEIVASTGEGQQRTLPSNEVINAKDTLANVSMRGVEDNIVIEVNDEIVLRYLALYVKTTRLMLPLVKAATGMWNAVQALIKNDCEDLVAFVLKRKE